MSYDLRVHSPQKEMVRKEALHEMLLAAGWEIRFLAENAFTGEAQLPLLPATGALEDALLAGWPAAGADSLLLAQLFAAADAIQLEKLYMEEDAFCTCGLAVSSSVTEEIEGEIEGKIKEGIEESTATEYSLRLSGLGIVSGWEFTHAVWEAIGELSGGELVNPQDEF